ncbi:TSC10 [Candida oxycetoniae]|uniref:3-ketodihydrosphingosine reductase TSC10 n=1 Tax=Candida oxycetoniae TaxID=497107 RepID=A0AAI9WXL0_9ASCO|nr:TSC10 [Candida oxycetoniae]KAI3404183.2 TSC10 [Candida oxycetoniae]
MWFSKSHFNVDGKTALIVGASQGLGVDLARKLYLQNCSIVLVARTTEKLQFHGKSILALETGPSHTAKVTYFTCDASKYEDCQRLWKDTYSSGFEPNVIICCAGSSMPKLFNDLTANDISLGIDVNYKTAVNIVHSGFKYMLTSQPSTTLSKDWPQRHIVLFGSVVGFFPFIGYGQYAPMKAAIDSLSIILRQELKPYNFRVSCVYPGNFQSEGFEEEQRTKPQITKTIEGPSKPISGEECAGIIIDKLSKGYDTITTDFIGWLLSCSVLGVRPHQWWIFQVIVSFIFSIIEPIVMWTIGRDIANSFKK